MAKRKHIQLLEEIEAKLGALATEFQALTEERDGLRMSLRLALQKERGNVETKEARILRQALAGKVGWREEARKALGFFEWLTCENCGKQFESGGKRKKKCGEC